MRLARHFHFMASTASMIASEDPTVAVPVPSAPRVYDGGGGGRSIDT